MKPDDTYFIYDDALLKSKLLFIIFFVLFFYYRSPCFPEYNYLSAKCLYQILLFIARPCVRYLVRCFHLLPHNRSVLRMDEGRHVEGSNYSVGTEIKSFPHNPVRAPSVVISLAN